jgi:hypothetical protein
VQTTEGSGTAAPMSSGDVASTGAVTTGTRRWEVAIGHWLLGRWWASCSARGGLAKPLGWKKNVGRAGWFQGKWPTVGFLFLKTSFILQTLFPIKKFI